MAKKTCCKKLEAVNCIRLVSDFPMISGSWLQPAGYATCPNNENNNNNNHSIECMHRPIGNPILQSRTSHSHWWNRANKLKKNPQVHRKCCCRYVRISSAIDKKNTRCFENMPSASIAQCFNSIIKTIKQTILIETNWFGCSQATQAKDFCWEKSTQYELIANV